MNQLSDRLAAIYRYRIALDPAIRCGGSELSHRQGLLLRLQWDSDEGYGETAPLPGFSDETLTEAQQDLTALAQDWLTGRPLSPVASASARFGFSCAQHELAHGPLQRPAQQSQSAADYPLLQGDLSVLLAGSNDRQSVKLKLARQPLALEIDQVNTLLQRHPQLRLRIDCNQGWSLEQAIQFVAAIPANAIEYLEEPCAGLLQTLQLSTQTGVGVALDESLRHPDFSRQPSNLPIHPGIKALVIKPSLTGSLNQINLWIALGQARGVRAILSSSYESSLGLGQLAALASQLTPNEPAGLDTAAPFSANLVRKNHIDGKDDGKDEAKDGIAKPILPLDALECLWHS